jgi:1-phosphatidylinositol phosphodiesterase
MRSLLLAAVIAMVQTASAMDLSNWMATLDGKKRLSEFSIPGTHDSGALHEFVAGTAQCQVLPIAPQLSIGVRFLDVRCVIKDGGFTIYHGSVDQQLTFDSVLNDCSSFLQTHKGETIIMSVQKEHKDDDETRFEQVFDSYTSRNPSLWMLTNTLPKLDEARGKIVLIRRFVAGKLPKGIAAPPADWKDNQSFTILGATEIHVQDKYALDKTEDKWPEIQPLLKEAVSGKPDALYLNFTSGYFKKTIFNIPDIPRAASAVNPLVENYFDKATAGRYGIIIMDFADTSRCEKIIATNN